MNHSSSITTETEEIEFAAAYGTAVAMIDKRHRTIPNHQSETLERRTGNVTGRLSVANGTDRHLGGPHSSQPDDTAVNPVPPRGRQSKVLTAVPGVGKGRRNRPQPGSDVNHGRKAA